MSQRSYRQGLLKREVWLFQKPYPGNTKWGSITVPLPPVWLVYQSVLQIKTKTVSIHTADSKPVKQEVNSTMIFPLKHSLLQYSKRSPFLPSSRTAVATMTLISPRRKSLMVFSSFWRSSPGCREMLKKLLWTKYTNVGDGQCLSSRVQRILKGRGSIIESCRLNEIIILQSRNNLRRNIVWVSFKFKPDLNSLYLVHLTVLKQEFQNLSRLLKTNIPSYCSVIWLRVSWIMKTLE